MVNWKKSLTTARANMFNIVSQVYPDATLDDDKLVGERYAGYYSSETAGPKLALCSKIFTDGSEVEIYDGGEPSVIHVLEKFFIK